MSSKCRPQHEVLLAGAVALLSLVIIAVVIAHNYPGRLPAGEADSIYRSPMLRIRSVGKRIGARFARHVPIGDLDKLYEERIVEQIIPEEEDVDPDGVGVVEVPVRQAEFQVTGIAWSARQPLAFIDGRGVVPGDLFEGWEVAGITESSVTLKASDGTLKKIGLYDQPEGEVKKRSESNMQKAEVDAHY